MLIFPSTLRYVTHASPIVIHDVMNKPRHRSLEHLRKEVTQQFTAPINTRRMLSMSKKLRHEYRKNLQSTADCMLPSFNHTLPSGLEMGTYLALDVGGSTFRVALVELKGRARGTDGLEIIRMSSSPITNAVRRLSGTDFFDWMAERIESMLVEGSERYGSYDKVLPTGLAWSFPIEQTSTRGGKIQAMGKGFCCHHGTIGQDLGELIVDACKKRNLKVRVDAIINDSSAALLSRAYYEPSTSMSLILGTGTNMAAYLPVCFIGESKFGERDPAWHEKAERVITNTELSMFGKGILPETRWDDSLNSTHKLPDFQPLEYMVTGRYLGEILRLIIFEAVESTALFGGHMPISLQEPYSLDTAILAMLEEDISPGLSRSAAHLEKTLPLLTLPTTAEVTFLRTAAEGISRRAAAYLATAIHALWTVEQETSLALSLGELSEEPKTTIACNGSVVVKYPGFRARCQDYINQMITAGSSDLTASFSAGRVILEAADDATILGAAVAVALCKD